MMASLKSVPPIRREPVLGDVPPDDGLRDRAIGHYIRQVRGLSDLQIGQILAYQRANGLRFGEAAIALKLATSDDVLWALSQQFDYPYAASEGTPLHADLVAALEPFGDEAEAFRELRSQLLMGVLAEGGGRRAVAVLSPDVGDGKSYFAANLAISFSQLGGRTLLVDGDMRTPRQHLLFSVDGEVGLSSILAGRAEASVIHQVPGMPTLYVLPVGTLPPNPLELVQRPAAGLLVQELLTKFDHVIVDTPAAVHGADSRVLAARSGGAFVIGRRGRTRIRALRDLIATLASSQVRLAGVVLNEL
ncbi:MAG TPA: tyrosine protein kinase [Burkholderiaceae bacterium]|nr:tyrosine protein kinase [Burkholderiaceae bacterium]HSB98640.1 tyrosine protein kinase [Burkholderiaceae bacterium]